MGRQARRWRTSDRPRVSVSAARRWIAGVAVALGVTTVGVATPAAHPPNIVLVTIDTLRADHLGSYGYARPTSPNLDALAARGVRFEHCYSTSSWTVPAMNSLVTGVTPAVHGIVHGDLAEPSGGGAPTVVMQETLSDAWTTLAEVLKARGYATAGFSTNGHLVRGQGFAQGFDTFDETCVWRRAACINPRVLAWLDSPAARPPFFLWVHYFDPHQDDTRDDRRYDPPPPYDGLFAAAGPPRGVARSMALYDGEIRYTDTELGKLLDRVAAITTPTLVVVTADHGEEFLERGNWGHTKTVYDELVRVPLIVVPPGSTEGRTVATDVGLLDVMPTLADVAGAPPVAGLEGTSLVPLLDGGAAPAAFADRGLYAETRRWSWLDRRSWIVGSTKLVADRSSGTRKLYDLRADPGERTDLSRARKPVVKSLLGAMKRYLRRVDARGAAKPPLRREDDQERIQKLRSLGYLQ